VSTDEWLSVSEAAKLVNYHPESIRELIRDGKVEGRKFSIVWQVDRESLLTYITEIKNKGKKRGPKPTK
jgi:excisionase family DNA binding protein